MLRRHASAWKSGQEASFIFDLQPAAGPYRLAIRLETYIDAATKGSIALKINDRPVALTWKDELSFSATVPPGELVNGVNTVSIGSSTRDDYFGLSLSLRSLALFPL